MTRPFNRVIDAVAEIAQKFGATVESNGDRLADNLEAIAENMGGIAANQDASSAADVAGVVTDLNTLINNLKNAGVMEPDKWTMAFATVTDSISGRADRQYNTDKISSVAEEDGVITITLSCKVSELKDFNAGGNWGVHKWLGIGIGVGINPITGLKYNGTSLGAEDVEEATQVGLSAGYFVRWVAADLVLAGNNSLASKDAFTLWANGYGTVKYTIRIVEG